MKQLRNTKGLLETLLVIGLILLIPLFFAIKTGANPQSVSNTVVPVIPTVANAPADINALKPKQPSACTFPLANITTPEATPENYTFSEPQVVLTAPEGNSYDVEWLPDSQQVLITEGLRNQYVDNNTAPQQSISLYNLETGESKLYAVRTEINEPPMWQPDINGVVYSAMNYTNIDKKNGAYKFTLQLWVSYGDPNAARLLGDNLPQLPFAIKPSGSEMMYLSGKQISKLDKSLKKLSSASFDPSQWDYAKSRRDDNPVSYQMTWQPGTSLIFLYSAGGDMLGGGYTFMLDTATGHICELNLGGWAERALWTSDGRYLAIARPTSYTGLSDSVDLVILDSITGNLHTVDVVSPDVKGKHYVTDFTWAPDNLHLLVLEDIPSTYDPYRYETVHHALYLVNSTSDESIQLFPEFKSFIGGGAPWSSFAWSPDGSKLLVRCPITKMGSGTDRFCLISVQRTGQ